MTIWNPWHGCHKLSAGCKNCYVYRIDARHGGTGADIHKTQDFDLPIRKKRDGSYKIKGGQTVGTCFTSDFFLGEADPWRPEAWDMMRARRDLSFFFITKRIDRFYDCIPPDWGDGYDNVSICCTVENQEMADYRLPIYKEAPIKCKSLALEPLLGPIDLTPYIGKWLSDVEAGGESGDEARVCDYEWVLSLRRQCAAAGVQFHFRQTGAKLLKDGQLFSIERKYQASQARKAGIDFMP